jgi:hypothetical protein
MYSVELSFLFDDEKEVSRRSIQVRFLQPLLRFAGGLDFSQCVWGGTPDLPKVIPCSTHDVPSHSR